MHLNKNLKNSGWILCPSKSFPGKFYYFNVLNGEAAWSLTDDENKPVKKGDTIHKITDKSHCYPEPDTPPIESPETSGSNFFQTPKKPENQRVSYIQPNIPTFGQASFPKYFPSFEPCVPNIVWAPIPYPNPIYYHTEVRKPMLDQITQTSEYERGLSVHTCNMPLCKRFLNYETPVLTFDKSNKILNKNFFTTSTPIKPVKQKENFLIPDLNPFKTPNIPNSFHFQTTENMPRSQNTCSTQTNSQAFHFQTPNTPNSNTFQFQSETNLNPFQIQSTKQKSFQFQMSDIPNSKPFQFGASVKNKPLLKEPVLKYDIGSNNFDSNTKLDFNQISTLAPCNKVSNKKSDSCAVTDFGKKDGIFEELESNDLRLVLVAKRQQLNRCDIGNTENIKPNPVNQQPIKEVTKKKVSFDLSNLSIEEFEETNSTADVDQKNLKDTIDLQPNCTVTCKKIQFKKDLWYLVVDAEVLLEDYEFIIRYVQLDEKCRLLVPHVVRSAIDTLSMGDNRGQERIYTARRLSRLFASPPSFFAMQKPNSPSDVTMFTVDNILTCCVEAMNECRVILVTNDPRLKAEASALDLESYNLAELKKQHHITKTDVVFDLKKIKIIINNDLKANNPISVSCSPNEIKPTVDIYKPKLFETTKNNNLDCNKLINITKPKSTVQNSEKPLEVLKNTTQVATLKNNNKNCQFGDINANLKSQDDRASMEFKKPLQKSSKTNLDELVQKSNDVKKSDWKLYNEDSVDEEIITKSFYFDTEGAKDSVPPSFRVPNLKNAGQSAIKKQILSVDENLKRFYVKSKNMDEKIKTRIEEWVCCFTQIMEDILNDVLMIYADCVKNNLDSPWILQEALQYIGLMYGDDKSVTTVVNKLTELLNVCVCPKGQPKNDMKSNDYMKILGCGMILVQILKTIHPDDEGLPAAETSLKFLLDTIECQSEPNIDKELLKTPVVCRSEMANNNEERQNYVKDTAYIIDYLKKHYKDWEFYEMSPDELKTPKCTDFKVVRTFGKNLNMLKINNDKCMTFKTTVNTTNAKTDKANNTTVNAKITIFEDITTNKEKTVAEAKTDKISPFTFNAETAIPKVIDDKVKEPLNMEVLDYEIISSNISKDLNLSYESYNATDVSFERMTRQTDVKIGDKQTDMFRNMVSYTDLEESFDSGFENDSTIAHSVVKIMFTEISECFKTVHGFVEQFVKEIRVDLGKKRKSVFHDNAATALEDMRLIVRKLKDVIEREADEENGVRKLILKAGVEAATDKRITRYRQVVTKCMEQARILENALKMIVCITEGDFESMSIKSDSVSSSIRYFNIFE